MEYIQRNPEITRAAKFDGSSATNIRSLGLTAIVTAKGNVKVTTADRIAILPKGTWVCTKKPGSFFVRTEKEFRDMYVVKREKKGKKKVSVPDNGSDSQ